VGALVEMVSEPSVSLKGREFLVFSQPFNHWNVIASKDVA
jgi:hypothetical protein